MNAPQEQIHLGAAASVFEGAGLEGAAAAFTSDLGGPPDGPQPPVTDAATPEPKKMIRPDFYRLCKWMEVPDRVKEYVTKAELARRATSDLGFHVADSAIDDALQATELAIPPKPIDGTPEAAIKILARELIALYRSQGKEPPAQLLQIA